MFRSFLRRVAFGALVCCAVASSACAQKTTPVQKVGKYAVELRVPANGVFAGRQVDLAFRISDTSRVDPVLGAPGVGRARIAATVTMPSMPSMPPAVPKIHSEVVPGDYGLVTTFPHGGDYSVALSITPPGDQAEPFTVAFPLLVKDEPEGNQRAAPAPYALDLTMQPVRPVTGQPVTMTLTVVSRPANKPVTAFDVMHEKAMHLIIVRDDLGAFFHEHPTLDEKTGVFTHTFTFPSGGSWRVFGDLAPRGAGQQIVSAGVSVDGARALRAPLMPTMLPLVRESGLTLAMRPGQRLPARQTVPVSFTLADSQGRPVIDLQPWLGALSHLILIEKDAQTFVHSHPDETDARSNRTGVLTFLVRFPKPGIYKGWVQFQRAGRVITMPFVVRASDK